MSATIESTNIPIAMVGLLTALPNTQMQRRLEREGRMNEGWAQSPEGSGDQCTVGLNFKTLRPRRDILADHKAVLERIYAPAAFFARLSRMTARLSRPKLVGAKFNFKHWRRSGFAFLRMFGIVTFVRPRLALPFWRYVISTLLTNPRAIEFTLMNVAMYLHVGRFADFVVADMGRRLAEIDAGVDATAPRLSDADIERAARKRAAVAA